MYHCSPHPSGRTLSTPPQIQPRTALLQSHTQPTKLKPEAVSVCFNKRRRGQVLGPVSPID